MAGAVLDFDWVLAAIDAEGDEFSVYEDLACCFGPAEFGADASQGLPNGERMPLEKQATEPKAQTATAEKKKRLHLSNRKSSGLKTGKHSRYRGVSWYRRTEKWSAQIKYKGVRKHIGYFATEIEAAEAYASEYRKMHKIQASKVAEEGNLDGATSCSGTDGYHSDRSMFMEGDNQEDDACTSTL